MGTVAMPGDMVFHHNTSEPLKEIDTRGESMNNWEIIKVISREGYSAFYSEEFGLATSISLQGIPIDQDGKQLQNVCANYNPNTRRISDDLYEVYNYSIETEYSIETLFDLKFYRYKPETQQNYYYGRTLNPIRLDSAEEISNIKYNVVVNYETVYVDINGNSSTQSKKKTFIISKKEELQDIMVWATKDKVKSYVMPVLMDLQEGKKYFYIGSGVCKVVKVYDYPNKQSNNVCRIVFANGVEQDVLIGDKRFVYIPLEYKSELLQFNKTLNELALQPVMQRNQEHNLINVMWQPIEDAARYVVKLYRYVNTENRRKVYFLKDYEVDRNEHFLSINDLIVNGHIIVVVAENRSGEVVAQSRGIDVATSKGEPKWF
jgi:uncharacterized protein (UPF0248 family)